MMIIEFSQRQLKIIEIVKTTHPITSEQIAKMLNVTRATLRPDLAILTMTGALDAKPKVGYIYSGGSASNIIAKHINSIKVKDMKSMPVVIDEKATLYDAIITLFLEDVGNIYVLSDGYLSGVVSRKDFLKNIMGGIDINKVPVGLIMTRMPNIVMTSEEETILEAAIKVIEHEVDSLPVVEKVIKDHKENYKVIGRISKTNITKLFVELGRS
ncbi:helix-turn-helix transcriptional regulator [Lutibacter sp. B2]|nr:helix-turn-helix transcriptional regulator [Lutibacter sp. B2]